MRTGTGFNSAVNELVSHGYTEKEILSEAKSQIAKWYKDGEISEHQAISWWQRYCGLSSDEATEKADAITFVKRHPEVSGISNAAIKKYETSIAKTGMSVETFYEAYKHLNSLENDEVNGKPVYYSAVKKGMAYIDSLHISNAQKDALALMMWKESTVNKYKAW